MEQLKDDVEQIVDDYLLVNSVNVELNDILNYTLDILSKVNDKYHYKKYIYPEIVKQLICRKRVDLFGKYYNNFKITDHSTIVQELLKIPQCEQRTPEWFKMKEDTIGASEAASIFGKNAFSTENELLLKKAGHKDPSKEFKMNPYCLHGTKYEAIAQLLYSINEKTEVIEFGSLPHPTISCVSASPDGITPTGVMLEIKVPYRRKITGIPPIYYWIQMQQQLQVCNLDKVDFLECDIREYLSYNDFIEDKCQERGDNEPYTAENYVKNAIIEYHKIDEPDPNSLTGWIYPDRILNIDEIKPWIEEKKIELEKSSGKLFSREIYFRVTTYSLCEVWKDQEWWDNNSNKYTEFWDKVEYHRKNGYNELIKKSKKYEKPAPVCIIESDDEDNKSVKVANETLLSDDSSLGSVPPIGGNCNIESDEEDEKSVSTY